MILIINNHGQYVHRIWRSMNYLSEKSEIIPNTAAVTEIKEKNPSGIIFSGGPYSVYEDKDKLKNCNEILNFCFNSQTPVLGICLGHQLITQFFGGTVSRGEKAEYAQTEITVCEENDLFKALDRKLIVWESHKDEVTKLPENLECLASSEICLFEAIKHNEKPIYGVQFHPEVDHTPKGLEILKNFLCVCKAK